MKCCNASSRTREMVRSHLLVHGIVRSYTFWYHHGERLHEPESDSEFVDNNDIERDDEEDEIHEILGDLYPNLNEVIMNIGGDDFIEEEAKQFYSHLKDFEQPIYEGSKDSKLSTLVKLLHIKSIGKWSNASFTMLLKMLKEGGSNLPTSYYNAKKIIWELGFSYQKIDACKNNCTLYWKDDALLESCKVCGTSRWKEDKRNRETKLKHGKKIPCKILRYFPLKPRLERLFMSSKTSSLMKWHHDERINDGIMKHPADSVAWKTLDELHPSFAIEPRKVLLGLASDEELMELWETGVKTFDASSRQNFMLHASLLWTINDFPAYANLSRWSTKGKLACPCCNKETLSIWLKNGNKQCYMRHRRFLPRNHKWRNDKNSFDGTKEHKLPPKMLSGNDILDQVADLDVNIQSKDPKKKTKISHGNRVDNWNKKSIFFDLPYWKTLLLRHNLDVMHIEKNIYDNILGTILNVKGKTKDTINSRLDLEVIDIKKELHPIKKGDKYELPTACYTLSPEEKHKFFNFLKNLKVPDGFSSNISQCVNLKDRKLSRLKSHDYHVILQHLLPLAIRGMLCKSVLEPLIELSIFFNMLGAKCLRVDELEKIEAQIPITLCKLEKVFIPAFFDIMVHLPIHLANEPKIAGPIQYRWMYLVERWLYFLKSFIRNRTHPEGSIAEGYIETECMTLCSRYLHTVETRFNRTERNYDGDSIESDGGLTIFSQPGKTSNCATPESLESDEFEQPHFYILKNCDEIQPFLEEFSQVPFDTSKNDSEIEWNSQFISWLQIKVAELRKHDDSKQIEDLFSPSRGPLHMVIVVGETDEENKTIDYYGELTEILELQFVGGRRVMFRCAWFDVYDQERGIKVDEYGFVSVNRKRLLKVNEPFVLANQASQVFYVDDLSNKGWHVVRKVQPCDSFDIGENNDGDLDNLLEI
ncbi:hypothetical protein MTR67_048196 [Solanum verrucosum]|uniref:Uncharacterized protein n=2 Tax=Solanum verrucosum TaxID=315347 RepID=A0AAF0ZX52_SOLVR|nr:hypothetical protein MTR67_048196 [Solanum verrucosum]